MSTTIQTTMDRAGRLVLPKVIREQAHLVAGVPLGVEVIDGRIEIFPAPREVRIVKKGRLKVAVPVAASEALTSDRVRDTLDSVRARRGVGR
jgi:AbrB family looped-hinge helix DNA binding protein